MTSPQADADVLERFKPLFMPRTIAVVGASAGGTGPANNFLRHVQSYGYTGAIYPIHPSAERVGGLVAFRSLGETPLPVDYAYVAVAAERVPAVLTAGHGHVRFAQVMSSGFGEQPEGRALQDELVAAARAAGVRLLGPNCMGTHSPRGRLTFVEGAQTEPGPVGVLAQSGGLSIDILKRGRIRGIAFSGLVTLGNSADLGACELLEYFLADPETRVIGMYLEYVAQGRRLFELLRAANGTKPIVLLKGGRTRQGERATASHTGALAGDDRIWTGLARQTGMAMVDTLDEFLDALLAFQLAQPHADRATSNVALFGNGGGTSVLAADTFGLRGFDVGPFPAATHAALGALGLPPGSSIDNPIDTPANALRQEDGRIAARIIDAVLANKPPDALVIHVNLPVLLDYKHVDLVANLLDAVFDARARSTARTHFFLVLRSDGEPAMEARRNACRERAVAAGIPTFNEMADAAKALSALRALEAFRLDVRRDARRT